MTGRWRPSAPRGPRGALPRKAFKSAHGCARIDSSLAEQALLGLGWVCSGRRGASGPQRRADGRESRSCGIAGVPGHSVTMGRGSKRGGGLGAQGGRGRSPRPASPRLRAADRPISSPTPPCRPPRPPCPGLLPFPRPRLMSPVISNVLYLFNETVLTFTKLRRIVHILDSSNTAS